MREILFRGKRVNNGEWVYGYYEKYCERHCISIVTERLNSGSFPIRQLIDVIPETVGQFTGVTDKNDTKIFEGDICKIYRGVCGDEILIVNYDECTARFILSTEGLDVEFDWFLSCKVIGNVHDNPEFLGGGENG